MLIFFPAVVAQLQPELGKNTMSANPPYPVAQSPAGELLPADTTHWMPSSMSLAKMPTSENLFREENQNSITVFPPLPERITVGYLDRKFLSTQVVRWISCFSVLSRDHLCFAKLPLAKFKTSNHEFNKGDEAVSRMMQELHTGVVKDLNTGKLRDMFEKHDVSKNGSLSCIHTKQREKFARAHLRKTRDAIVEISQHHFQLVCWLHTNILA